MGMTATSLVCSILVLRLVSAEDEDVPESIKKVRSHVSGNLIIWGLNYKRIVKKTKLVLEIQS